MKRTLPALLTWIGLLALVLSGCNKTTSTSAGSTAPPPPPQVGVGVAAAADSGTRFELWLISKQPDPASMPTVPAGKVIEDSLKDVAVPTLLTHLSMPEWQARLSWGWDDMGPMEPAVQRELAKLDAKYNVNAYAACVWPGSGLAGRVGRACVLQSYACGAAREKMDDKALDLSVATQMYDDAVATSVRSAGAGAVSDFLRTAKFCK